MTLSVLKFFALTALTACSVISTSVSANSPADENIEVTPVQKITQEELAAIYVLSEVCPPIVDNKEKFAAGYQKLTKEYLPQEKDSVSALADLSKQKKFQSFLKEARSDAKNAGNAGNLKICQELTNYSK
ncbi:MCR_0457 family protein [Acinetobacter chinensis]|jgi:hypothetical protein|uniref:MCR_0457 family protein n=1 Tax=Acinetobacter chinensis TaxID=2004650 RepID=UPI00293507E5|nr:hypothetical protein [Acinetobacter chinensis]WOE42780.1 hypothetical protein QSG87_06560 [Acinetobacter chinensis]